MGGNADKNANEDDKDFLSPELTKIHKKVKFVNSDYHKDEGKGHIVLLQSKLKLI